MRAYIAILFQLIIWSGFTFAEWLSKDDHLLYKFFMFLIFLYLATILANHLMKSTKTAYLLTIMSLMIYGTIHYMLQSIFH